MIKKKIEEYFCFYRSTASRDWIISKTTLKSTLLLSLNYFHLVISYFLFRTYFIKMHFVVHFCSNIKMIASEILRLIQTSLSFLYNKLLYSFFSDEYSLKCKNGAEEFAGRDNVTIIVKELTSHLKGKEQHLFFLFNIFLAN